jgi:hypothetical protein
MDRRGWWTAVAAAVGLAFVALVASSDPIQMFHEPTTTGFEPQFDVEGPPLPQRADPSLAPTEGFDVPLVSVRVERFVVGFLLLLIVLLAIRQLRRWYQETRPPAEHDFAVLPDVRSALAEAAGGTQRDELLTGSPRNAIVACWVRLEHAVERAGIARHRSETSAELTARVLSTYVVDRQAIDALAALYREARFSSHELSEHHRQRAVAALDELHRQLARPVETIR